MEQPQSSDTESQTSNITQAKCPTNAIKKFRKHETVNVIHLKQTVKTNTLDDEHNERTEETIKKAENDFALDLPMLVEETARDEKILNAITAIERRAIEKIIEEIFYPYRPHRYHLTTRFGLLFYNDKIVIPEAMRTTIIAMLHQEQDTPQPIRWINLPQHSGGPVYTVKCEKKPKAARAAERQVRI